ncbi:hypothetical protein GDO78_009188 [Eleutherodactylus coqui]|uniref:Uncharacterized protein n=1 Tax=Eleutherodactylus coqui TaxID=57060 RepID=A0A8J6K929_ELECQ|nr:hypothetical protein GDO78_009188 [Eleutherodactylus coqui]
MQLANDVYTSCELLMAGGLVYNCVVINSLQRTFNWFESCMYFCITTMVVAHIAAATQQRSDYYMTPVPLRTSMHPREVQFRRAAVNKYLFPLRAANFTTTSRSLVDVAVGIQWFMLSRANVQLLGLHSMQYISISAPLGGSITYLSQGATMSEM